MILQVTRVAIESDELSNSTVQGLFLHTCCLAVASWLTQWTMTKLCRVVSHVSNNVYRLLVVIAHAKLKQSQLFEHGGIDDALQN